MVAHAWRVRDHGAGHGPARLADNDVIVDLLRRLNACRRVVRDVGIRRHS
jgi:hypothetical protein